MESAGTVNHTAIKEMRMSLIINTNTEALIAQNNLNTTETNLNTAMTDLSSGLRINTAADDAAGYAITEDLTAQVNGLNQANSNAQDATSLVQTADGALNDVEQMLQRVRELAVEYQGGTLVDRPERDRVRGPAARRQIEQIGNAGAVQRHLAVRPDRRNGTGNLTFQVGANDSEVISITLQALVVPTASSAWSTRSPRASARPVADVAEPRRHGVLATLSDDDRRGLDAGIRRSARSRTA